MNRKRVKKKTMDRKRHREKGQLNKQFVMTSIVCNVGTLNNEGEKIKMGVLH